MPKSKKHPQGAPLQLTTEQIDEIAAAVEQGAFISSAVQSVGYSRRAYQRWWRIGLAAIVLQGDGKKLTAAQSLYALFVSKVLKAEGKTQADAVIRMRELGESDADVLERFIRKRFPDLWPADQESSRGFKVNLEITEEIIVKPPKVPTDIPP